MARFTLEIPDELNTWLQQQAETGNIPKGQLIYQILAQHQRLSDLDRTFNLALDWLHQFEQEVRRQNEYS